MRRQFVIVFLMLLAGCVSVRQEDLDAWAGGRCRSLICIPSLRP
ncbi:hypothetical protein SAMN05444169_6550 [Bradyrhizobium erythrophlei]|uniref:Lipoprotein n=1 Tax=Bradyrhizobium erythrophlei TaxID=1437360 RepID=A0A1M5RGA4_9BRAD|nr:hypothetical protein SAMN05444169_6550 [Bradyrhizobium erythrophlei]